MYYVSTDSSQRVLQTNEKIFFQISYLILKFWLKADNFHRKIFKRKRCMNINQIAMCYVSMDSAQRALQNK